MYEAGYVAQMVDFLIHSFILGAYDNHAAPNVVDCSMLDETTLEITMTDETVFIVRVEKLELPHR